MRKIDNIKANTEKAAKTINFDKIVLLTLENKAALQSTTVSNMVNMLIRQIVLKDVEFYRELSKHHYLEFQKYQYMKDQAEETK